MAYPHPPFPLEPLHPWVQYLRDWLDQHGRLVGDTSLDAAVKDAVKDGISELKAWNITDADDFLQYASGLLKYWTPGENSTASLVYEVITVFYYIFDKAQINDLQTPIDPSSIGPDGYPVITKISDWITAYAIWIGYWLSEPASLTRETYDSFWNPDIQPKYKMKDYLIPDPNDPAGKGGFKNFNELFCRYLREPFPYSGVRPIDETVNSVVFPADSTFDGAWQIDDDNTVSITTEDSTNKVNNIVTSKTLKWPIGALLVGSPYADRFKGGTWCHAFLNTFDYHRQHAPVAGRILESRTIQGLCYLQVVKKQDKDGNFFLEPHRHFQVKHRGPKDVDAQTQAPDQPGYEFIQTRGLIVIDTETENGLVAVLPMGMAQVSSVKLSRQVGEYVEKGTEISWFEFGGSDIVLVFEKNANPTGFPPVPKEVDPPHHLMGEHLCSIGN